MFYDLNLQVQSMLLMLISKIFGLIKKLKETQQHTAIYITTNRLKVF